MAKILDAVLDSLLLLDVGAMEEHIVRELEIVFNLFYDPSFELNVC